VAMKARGFKKHPGLVQTSLKFKRPGQSEEEEPGQDADFDTIGEKRVRDFTHLGELLRARDRPKAALQEYRKAMALGGDGNPMIQNGAAATLVALDQLDEIPELLDRVTRYYPTYLKTWLHLGEAWLKLGQPAKAREAFEQAVGINPFHPRPHQALAALYEAAGDAERAARARQSLELLK
jgi:tetratricopeptide (TPR) repeat protein